MVRRRFFVEGFTQGGARLEGGAAHHLARVLRAQQGQLYELSDGRAVFLARVEKVSRDSVDFKVLEPVAVSPPALHVTLLLAIVKFDRWEWALEKATELGADVIVPLAAERSVKPLVAAARKRAGRWGAILLEAAQQARCLWPPELRPAARPGDAFRSAKPGVRLLLSERPGAPRLRRVLEAQAAQPGSSERAAELCLAAGPEGGWTEGEAEEAMAAGFAEASLGDRVLRTETAVAAGLAAAHLYFDR